MEAIVLFITSLGIDLIVDITLSLNCSYVSVVIRDVIACLRNVSETNLRCSLWGSSLDFLEVFLEVDSLHGP